MGAPQSNNVWDDILKSVTFSSSGKSLLSHLLGPRFLHCNTVAGDVMKELSAINDHSVSHPIVIEQLSTVHATKHT